MRPDSLSKHPATTLPSSDLADRPEDVLKGFIDALVAAGNWLQAVNYQFTTVTPLSHARLNARASTDCARSIRDIFGWSRTFRADLLPQHILAVLDAAGLLSRHDGKLKSRVRFSTLGGLYFAHSAFPTSDDNAVFFGPDTYRFCNFVNSELSLQPLESEARVVDVGCGAGPGGLVAASVKPRNGLLSGR